MPDEPNSDEFKKALSETVAQLAGVEADDRAQDDEDD